MTTKLTLSVDPEIVDRAKRYASRRKTSVSKLVADYLDLITQSRAGTQPVKEPPVLRLLRGAARGTDPGDHGRHLMRKYL